MSELGKYKLPEGWAWATIPDLSGKAGVFIDGDWVESKDQDPDGDVRLIQLADVGDGFYRDKSDRFMTKAKAEELGCTFLKDGDVLIARMPDPLGHACIFPGDAKPSVTVVDGRRSEDIRSNVVTSERVGRNSGTASGICRIAGRTKDAQPTD
jgi:hypothetical protein